MKAEFFSQEEMTEMYHSGRTVLIHEPPYKTLPKNFEEKERVLFKALERELSEKFGADSIYVSYDTWADLAIRVFVDVSIFTPALLSLLVRFVNLKAPDHYLSCVVSQFEMDQGGHYGSFGFNSSRLLVDLDLRELWLQRIGAEIE